MGGQIVENDHGGRLQFWCYLGFDINIIFRPVNHALFSWPSNEFLSWLSLKRSKSLQALTFLVLPSQQLYLSFCWCFVDTKQSVWFLTYPGLMTINPITPRVSDQFAQPLLSISQFFLSEAKLNQSKADWRKVNSDPAIPFKRIGQIVKHNTRFSLHRFCQKVGYKQTTY